MDSNVGVARTEHVSGLKIEQYRVLYDIELVFTIVLIPMANTYSNGRQQRSHCGSQRRRGVSPWLGKALCL